MSRPRPSPYIWVTWLTKLLAGEEQCEWAAWFKAHNYVANSDRHRGNLRVDNPWEPREIHVFDHDQALFGARENEGIARLRELAGRLGVTGGSRSGGNPECLLEHMNTFNHFQKWVRRLSSIPDWFIEDICQNVVGIGATRQEAAAAIEFLTERRERLAEIIQENRESFPLVPNWGLFL